MKSVRSTNSNRFMLALSIAVLGASACADESAEGSSSSALTISEWGFCAAQNQRCSFDGSRNVRFGANGVYAYRTLTGPVACTNETFNVAYGEGNQCELFGAPAAAAQPASPAAAVEASAPMDHTMHSTANTAAAPMPMAGPYINRAAIPTGSAGVGSEEIRPTTDKPLANNDVGAFRTSCAMSHMAFDDGIVFPGQPGKAHLHAFFGNTGSDAYSTAESLRTSGNSTCRGGIANRSSYWVPAVIDKSGTPIKPKSAQIYYKTGYNGIAPKDVKVFPEGLRVIAGDMKTSEPIQEHAFWSCEVYNGHPKSIPDCPAGQKVIMQIFFPQCWNGVDLDSADHKSHMAYPANGACPGSHPVAIPEISFNVYYDVPAGTRSSEWRLSSDMYDQSKPGGYSAHGDWFEGWKRDVAEAFVKNCNQTQSDCHSHLLGDGREIYSSLKLD